MKDRFELWKRCFSALLILMAAGLLLAPQRAIAVSAGDIASDFTLTDIEGGTFSLSSLKDRQLTILYFFAPGSRASTSGIELLSAFFSKEPDWDVKVVSIAEGTREQAGLWAKKNGVDFVVLSDDGKVAGMYGVGSILPVAYLVGPDFVILNKVSGGGKGGHKLLVRLAERELSRKRAAVAEKLAKTAIEKAPADPEARAVLGYAALRQGKIDEAENVFRQISSSPEGVAVGKEGLAHVRMKQGQTKEALALASEAEGRAGATLIKGDLLYSQGKKDEARAAYQEALDESAFSFQQANPYNRLGRLALAENSYSEASKYYDSALKVDPLAVEVLSNKGVALGREGKWGLAAQTYQKVLERSPGDKIAMGLLRQAQEMLALAKDAKKAERIDRLITNLSERYRKGRYAGRGHEDDWTSRPMVLAFLPLNEGGLPMDREGVSQVLALDVGQRMEASGRVCVVERAVLDKLLGELNLGSSELADPDTALRLGRVLSARLLAAGSIYNGPGEARLSLRLIDSETSAIPALVSTRLKPDQIEDYAGNLAESLLEKIRARYPLRGYVVRVRDRQVILNIGRKQGVETGMRMALLIQGKPIKFMGRKLKGDLEQAGSIKVTRVEEDLSYGQVLTAAVKVKKGIKVEEIRETGGRIQP